MTRAEALEAGLTRYFTGVPCKHGHVSERIVSNKGCLECLQQGSVALRKRNVEKERQRIREKYARNKERYKEIVRAWQAKNSGKVLLYRKATFHNRRSRQEGGMSSAELSAWMKAQGKKCYWCGTRCAKSFHIDHYVPLVRGGAHVAENLVIACPACNMSKNARDPYEFAQHVGRLF